MRPGILQPLGRIDRYVARLFVASYATACFLIVGLFLILDMAQNLDDFLEPMQDGSSVPVRLIAGFYLLNLPFLFLQVAPFVTLVAGLFTVAKLLKHNETVAALAAGVSAQRLLLPVFVLGALVAGGMFGLRESLGVTLAFQRDSLRWVLSEKRTDEHWDELWVKDRAGSLVHVGRFHPRRGDPPRAEIENLEALLFSASHWNSVTAKRAVWTEHPQGGAGWLLEGGLQQQVRGEQHSAPAAWLEGFDLTPQLLATFHRALQPLELSYAEVRELASRDPDNVTYQTLLQYLLTFPLANLVLLLVGLPILMRHHERRRGAEGLAAACILCVFFFAADFVCRNLGLQGTLSPHLAAWLPVIFFVSLGAVLFESMRT